MTLKIQTPYDTAYAEDHVSALLAAYELQRDHTEGTSMPAPTAVITLVDSAESDDMGQHVLTITRRLRWDDCHVTEGS